MLFLDELPEFPRQALEALREPLETGHVTISRAARQAHFPARFQLIAAMNPCPCGWLGAGSHAAKTCRCSPDMVARYQGRISGPLLDRIDMQVEVPAVPAKELLTASVAEPTAAVKARVAQARGLQEARQACTNSMLAPAELEHHSQLHPSARALLEAAAMRLGWSGRSLHRVIRLARTIADLEQSTAVETSHIAEAIQYRRALPGG